MDWISTNSSGADDCANHLATQLLIWETVIGERDENFNKINAHDYGKKNIKEIIQSNHPLKSKIFAHYDRIEESVKNHTKTPSFTAKSKAKAKTIELKWNGKNYSADLTDSNKVLAKDACYPLIEWNMTERDCLQYCYERGFTWGGLYEIFHRVSCWCCPLQSFEELRKLRKHFPELWKQLEFWDKNTWRTFKPGYSVKALNVRFDFEEERQAQGKSIRNKEFYTALRERLKEVA